MDEYDRMEAIGSEDDFLLEWHERVSALIQHGNLVNNFLEELRERKEQEKIQLRTTRKQQYVHHSSLEIAHPNQRAFCAGSTSGSWRSATRATRSPKTPQNTKPRL
jgi:hypothetical protein